MLRPFVMLVLVLVTACAHAHPSRWEDASGKHTCVCDGTERNPTPSEAEAFRPGERIDTFCEGRIHDCRDPREPLPGVRGPWSPRNNVD